MDGGNLAWVGLFINVIVLAVGGAWAVGKIRETTSVLSEAISNLKQAIERLDKTISDVQEAHNAMAQRVAVLEERTR